MCALVNKHFHNLAFTAYYYGNTFVVGRSPRHAANSWYYPQPSIGAWIRKLEVHVKVGVRVSLPEVCISMCLSRSG